MKKFTELVLRPLRIGVIVAAITLGPSLGIYYLLQAYPVLGFALIGLISCYLIGIILITPKLFTDD